MSPCPEKASLLPAAQVDEAAPAPSEPQARGCNRTLEVMLLIHSLLLALSHLAIIYFFRGASCAPTFVHTLVSQHLCSLAEALPVAISSGLPTAAALIILAPMIAKEDRIELARCLVLFFYLFGATLGAIVNC
jgi:hypothetical protein